MGTQARADGETSLPPLPVVGDIIGDRYRIVQAIGAGGMGRVYEAEHLALRKTVALKILSPRVLALPQAEAASRFVQEARVASGLQHPGIVEISDFGETEGGLPFIVMELLLGESLGAVLEREQRLSWPEAKRITLEILEALSAAHEAGVVHRDIKPENCFVLHGSGSIKLLDFGIAKVIRDADATPLTNAGDMLGTPQYISPEQARGVPLDGRADLYSVGVLLFEMVSGTVPFPDGSAMAIVARHLTEPPPPLRSVLPSGVHVPEGLERLLERVLAKDPDQRPPSAAALSAALHGIDESAAIASRRPGWIAAAVVVAALMVASAWLFASDGRPAAAPPAAKNQSIAQAKPRKVETVAFETPPAPAPAKAAPPNNAPVVEDAEPGEAEPIGAPASDIVSRKRPRLRGKKRAPKAKRNLRAEIGRAVASCEPYAAPGGVKVRVHSEVAEDGSLHGTHVDRPYAGTPLGRCVAKQLNATTVSAGPAESFHGAIVVGGDT